MSGTTIAMIVGVPAGALIGETFGWRSTFWAVALVCVPAILGLVVGMRGPIDPPLPPVPSAVELTRLRSPRLLLTMLIAVLVNGGTFAALTFLAPVVTGTASLDPVWVPLVLVLFGAGAFVGIVVAGRYSDDRPRVVLVLAAPVLVAGWLLLALLAAHPVVLVALVGVQGVLAFAVGSTLIAQVLHAAAGAPTWSGPCATVALNIDAVVGPVLGAVASARVGPTGPVWVAVLLAAFAVVLLASALRVVAPRGTTGVSRRRPPAAAAPPG